jgi:hypothetical protein
VELRFMARAAQQGLTVSKPWGDSSRYDFIVEHRGKFHRVQVKSTTWCQKGAFLCNTVSRPPQRKDSGRGYTRHQIDFFAFFIIPEDIWYIVPIAQLKKKAKYAVFLNPYQRTNKYFRNMEAWDLFRKAPQNSIAKRAARSKTQPSTQLP